jgi:hypothetical protein
LIFLCHDAPPFLKLFKGKILALGPISYEVKRIPGTCRQAGNSLRFYYGLEQRNSEFSRLLLELRLLNRLSGGERL